MSLWRLCLAEMCVLVTVPSPMRAGPAFHAPYVLLDRRASSEPVRVMYRYSVCSVLPFHPQFGSAILLSRPSGSIQIINCTVWVRCALCAWGRARACCLQHMMSCNPNM